MKGIRSKIVTNEETVRMHTNFAEWKNIIVDMWPKDNCTYSVSDDVLRIHTNTIRGWGVFASCIIPRSLLKAEQKYGISFVSNKRMLSNISLATNDGKYSSTNVKPSFWEGNRLTGVVKINEDNLKGNNWGIKTFLYANNTDYELSDFRIWEIDDATTGGAIVRFLFIMLATSLRKEVAA